MKRILVCLILAAVSMFFTGCNSLLANLDGGGYQEIKWDLVDGRNEWGSMGKDPVDMSNMPDYYEENDADKFSNLDGNRAFQIKEGHSELTGDMEDFQIGTLLEDGTFIYAYTTREAGEGDARRIVHCAAAYQYETGRFLVLYENVFSRIEGEEELESFYIQLCEGSEGEQLLFIYDNGMGYLYNLAGERQFSADIETFVRQHFSQEYFYRDDGEKKKGFGKAYSVSVTNAVTDGDYRLYVELTLEKEDVELPEVQDAEVGDDNTSMEDADKEAEELEDEIEETTIELILLYNFEQFSSTLDQENLRFDQQAAAWQQMAEGKTFTSHPDAEADWNSTVQQYPDVWGTAFLDYVELTDKDKLYLQFMNVTDYNGGGLPLFQWTGDKKFSYSNDGYVCEFEVFPLTMTGYKGYLDIQPGQKLENAFVMRDGRYREIYGTIGSSMKYYGGRTFQRTYTYKWYTTETNDEGEVVEKEHTQEYIQSLSKSNKRYVDLTGEYMEGFDTLTDVGATSIVGVKDNQVLLSSPIGLLWMEAGNYVGITNTWMLLQGALDEYLVDAFEDQGQFYLVFSSQDEIQIVEPNLNHTFLNGKSWKITSDMLQVESESLSAREMTEQDKKYVSAHEKLEESNMGDLANMVPMGHFDVAHICRVTLNRLADGPSGDGFLLTTMDKGLLFVQPSSGESVCVKEGTWYGTWRHGDKLVTVGFANEDTSYGTLDVAFSRVLEYDLNELYAEEVNRDIREAEEQAAKEASEAAARESAALETEEAAEMPQSPLEEWQGQKEEKEKQTTGKMDLEDLRDSMHTEREKIEEKYKEQYEENETSDQQE